MNFFSFSYFFLSTRLPILSILSLYFFLHFPIRRFIYSCMQPSVRVCFTHSFLDIFPPAVYCCHHLYLLLSSSFPFLLPNVFSRSSITSFSYFLSDSFDVFSLILILFLLHTFPIIFSTSSLSPLFLSLLTYPLLLPRFPSPPQLRPSLTFLAPFYFPSLDHSIILSPSRLFLFVLLHFLPYQSLSHTLISLPRTFPSLSCTTFTAH